MHLVAPYHKSNSQGYVLRAQSKCRYASISLEQVSQSVSQCCLVFELARISCQHHPYAASFWRLSNRKKMFRLKMEDSKAKNFNVFVLSVAVFCCAGSFFTVSNIQV